MSEIFTVGLDLAKGALATRADPITATTKCHHSRAAPHQRLIAAGPDLPLEQGDRIAHTAMPGHRRNVRKLQRKGIVQQSLDDAMPRPANIAALVNPESPDTGFISSLRLLRNDVSLKTQPRSLALRELMKTAPVDHLFLTVRGV